MSPFLGGPITVIVWIEKGALFGLAVLAGLIVSWSLLLGLAVLVQRRTG